MSSRYTLDSRTDGGVLSFEWSCPSCTYNNKAGAFKCHVCGTPKGTTTRQTKYHSSTVEQQVIAETMSQQLVRLQASRAANTAKSPPGLSSSVVDNGSTSSNGSSSKSHRKRSRSHKSKAATHREDYLWPKLANLDRSTGTSSEITVDNLTVIIAEYDLLYPDSDHDQ